MKHFKILIKGANEMFILTKPPPDPNKTAQCNWTSFQSQYSVGVEDKDRESLQPVDYQLQNGKLQSE